MNGHYLTEVHSNLTPADSQRLHQAHLLYDHDTVRQLIGVALLNQQPTEPEPAVEDLSEYLGASGRRILTDDPYWAAVETEAVARSAFYANTLHAHLFGGAR